MYKKDFPIFKTHPELVFLDSASSAQKPQIVIDGMKNFFENSYANIHRGAYDLSMESSEIYDNAKKKIKEFLHAESHHEIVFTYNATYAFNLIARALVKSKILQKGDKILLSKADHHANVVPWQIIASENNLEILWVDVGPDGTIDYSDLEEKIQEVKLLSITGASNVTGETLDLDRMKKIFSKLPKKPFFIVDGSQRFPHLDTDVVDA